MKISYEIDVRVDGHMSVKIMNHAMDMYTALDDFSGYLKYSYKNQALPEFKDITDVDILRESYAACLKKQIEQIQNRFYKIIHDNGIEGLGI